MIQDIFPHKLYNQYRPDMQPGKDDYVICIKEQNMLVDTQQMENQILEFPRVKDFTEELNLRYLLSVDDEHYYIYIQGDGTVREASGAEKKAEGPSLPGYDYLDIRKIRKSGSAPRYRIFALLTAKHLYDWYRDNVFCGRCGKRMVHSKKERAMMCECCGYTSYPRIMPAVIVGVRDNDRLLITRYRNGYQHNALVAGFTEIGETLEETVMREVMEETGIRVKNIEYYKSQPWGIANDILMGFYCDADGSTDIRMEEDELKYAEFVHKQDIVLQPDDFSLTNEMMKVFKES